jgi:acyl-CoA synthetase (AMP-forming)/AMP-acid ligase II
MRDESFIPTVSTAPEAIAWWAAESPEAPALLTIAGDAITYEELQRRIDTIGRQLATLGIGRQDRVVLALPDGLSTAIASLAVLRSAIAVPVNPAQPLDEAAPICDAVSPSLLIVASGSNTAWREAAQRRGIPVRALDAAGARIDGVPEGDGSDVPLPNPAPDDLAMILLTSGTTERPRCVPASHQALLEACWARAKARHLSRQDRALSCAPAYFVLGLARVIESLLVGGSAIVAESRDVLRQPDAIGALAPTWTWMSPAMLEALLEAAQHDPAIAQWPLRFVRTGSTLVTPELVARAEALWNVPVLNGYGTTETLGYIASEETPETVPRKPRSVGLVRAGFEIAIRDAGGAALPAGASGEITVRGDRVFPGYLNEPEATVAAFFPDRWYRTGDLGYLDEEGYLFVTGRVREMINRGGEKIAPTEIDDVLRQHPAVADAAAFALPDDRLGQDVAAAVVLRPGMHASRRELRAWMLDRLTRYKAPRRIWFVDELPRTGSRKVQRGVLTERFREPSSG